jgi:hypothetical protein
VHGEGELGGPKGLFEEAAAATARQPTAGGEKTRKKEKKTSKNRKHSPVWLLSNQNKALS